MSFISDIGFQPTSGQYARKHRQQVRDGGGRFAGGWGVAWQGLADIDAAAFEYGEETLDSLKERVESLKDEMVAYMKANAPWTDHPGVNKDARDNLQGVVVWEDDEHFTIMLGHGSEVYYGIWLEVRWGGKYAIVVPTIHRFAPLIGGMLTGGRG